MIAEPYILEWRQQFPWTAMQHVEQDLLISRCIVAIYSDPFLASRLAWRGGTALYKLYVKPQPRYSEDIDLVLINPEPMGPILDRLREAVFLFGFVVGSIYLSEKHDRFSQFFGCEYYFHVLPLSYRDLYLSIPSIPSLKFQWFEWYRCPKYIYTWTPTSIPERVV